MAKNVVIDELHITIRILNDLPDTQSKNVRRMLNGEEFLNRLRRALNATIRALPELTAVYVSLTR